MKELGWALAIVEAGYKTLLKEKHPDRWRNDANSQSAANLQCQKLAVARDELNSLIEATKYQAQPQQAAPVPGPIPGPPIYAPPSGEETVKRILDIAEVLIFGPKGPHRPRRPRRPGR